MARQQVCCTDARFMLLFVSDRGDDSRRRGEPSVNRSPLLGFWMTATSAVIRAWWRGSDSTRQRGEWDFSHLKGPPTPQIISVLKGRMLRLCFHRLRIHYCFSLIPSERNWQMKLKYAADTHCNKRRGSYLQRSACCSGSANSCREMP